MSYGVGVTNSVNTYNVKLENISDEIGGIIQINQGYYNTSFAIYEFHVISGQISINHISGENFISSYSFADNTVTLVMTTSWLRVRFIYKS